MRSRDVHVMALAVSGHSRMTRKWKKHGQEWAINRLEFEEDAKERRIQPAQ